MVGAFMSCGPVGACAMPLMEGVSPAVVGVVGTLWGRVEDAGPSAWLPENNEIYQD